MLVPFNQTPSPDTTSERLIGDDGLAVPLSPLTPGDSTLSCVEIIMIYLRRLWAHPTTQGPCMVIAVLLVLIGYPVGTLFLAIWLSPSNDWVLAYYIAICFGPIMVGPIIILLGFGLYRFIMDCVKCCREVHQQVQDEIKMSATESAPAVESA
jgi:hypothetical protein